MSRHARLGRGLASLIPDSALDAEPQRDTAAARLRIVPLDQVIPNPEQPRKLFAPEDLESLAASIREHGILNPLVVRRSEGRYILIAGERRLRAAGLAGLKEVPVVTRDAPGAQEQLELALVENLQRTDLDPVEEAQGYARLSKEFGLRQDAIAQRVGKNRTTIANSLRLLRLPEFALTALQAGRISAGHARALVPLADTPDDLRTLLARVLAQQLSVRATEKLVAQVSATPRPVRNATRARRENTFDYATRILTESLQTGVAIRPLKKGGGRIIVDYSDAEELERLITHMRRSA
jgi:ParB family chromosome partitioning protein